MNLKINFDIKPVLNYLAVILTTALGITTILVALPLTENLSERTTFNLLTKDDFYWSTEFLLFLETNNQEEIEKTRDILFKRLEGFGVEKISVRNLGEDEGGNTTLSVVVNTTKDRDLVASLIVNRFYVEIVTKKEGVNFFGDEDQFAYFLPENYEPSEWDRSDFRNVLITELKTTGDTYSYFALFKLWPNKQSAFTDFLEPYKGDYIGISVDGSITPYLVPFEDQNIFAVPATPEDEEQAKALDVLYNSGIIPTNLFLTEQKELTPQIVKVDHIRVSIGLLISFILVYAYMFLIKKADPDILKKSFLATVITISLYLTILKLYPIPVDTFILPIVGILTALLIKIISANRDSVLYIEAGLIAVLTVVILLGYGYMTILATHLIGLIVLSKLCLIVTGWYLNKVKRI